MLTLGELKNLVKRRRYRFSLHGEQEREADQITVDEFEEAMTSPKAEILESYPNDPRGPSCLVLGFTETGQPIHAVCGRQEEQLIVITIYRPSPQEWMQWRKRR